MLTLALKLPYKKGLITPISTYASSMLSDRFLTRKNESILLLNDTLFKRNISNFKKTNTNFLKKYIYKKILYTNSRITSTQQINKIDSVYLAKQFIDTLTQDEKNIIKEQLTIAEQERNSLNPNSSAQKVSNITFRQLLLVSLQSGLPFIGFGFVDNFIMICAGDIIETYIGFWMPVSTMAAAGLGNAISDVAGIGLAHHIEYFCSKLINVPKLTAEDWQQSIVHWCHVISKSICIFLGCLIGMFPLLFMRHEKKKIIE